MHNKGQTLEYIKTVPFSNFYNWSVQYLLESKHSYNENYELVRIGNFLRRNKTAIEVQSDEYYKRVTIKINNGGVFLRNIEKGVNIGTKKQFRISKNQFLLSKIDARNGAFGVVPGELDAAIITGNFWTFDVDFSMINPHFLALITTTPAFIKFSENASNGSTNRHYLQEELFLDQKIPLPPMAEQNRILDAYNRKINIAKNAENKAHDLEQSIENYIYNELEIEKEPVKDSAENIIFKIVDYKGIDRWAVDYLWKHSRMSSLLSGKYEVVSLKKIMFGYQYGLSEKASKENIGIPMLRMNNISNSEINFQDLKYIKFQPAITKFILHKGDLLFNRTNSKELVGKTAVFESDEQFTFASYLIRVTINPLLANVNYINYIFNSSILQVQKDLVSRQITGQANINSKEMQEFLFPLPPRTKQTEIATNIVKMKNRINKLMDKSVRNKREAILDFENEIFK